MGNKERIWEQKKEDWWPMLASSDDVEIEWSSEGRVRARKKNEQWRVSERRVAKADNSISVGFSLIND